MFTMDLLLLLVPVFPSGLDSNRAIVPLAFQSFIIPIVFIGLMSIALVASIPFVTQWFVKRFITISKIPTEKAIRKIAKNESWEKAIEFTGFAYESRQDIFYSLMYPWQRDFGYCRLYDEASAPLSMIVDCEPVYFEYNNKKWLIEFWKGQYGMTTGGEIGVYSTEASELDIPDFFSGTFYNSASDADLLEMSFSLIKDNQVLFKREDLHWWLTGFVLGEFSQTKELKMQVQITLKDRDMCIEFVKGLRNAGYSDEEFYVSNRTVRFMYDKTHTPQPITRTPATEWIMQKNNENLCEEYKKLTSEYRTTPEKLQAIQSLSPAMYKKILHMGKTTPLYETYRTINKHLK